MTKVTLNDLANLQNENTAVNIINNNNTVIETAFDNTLSRDGTTPNQMDAAIDMNDNQIVNLPTPLEPTSPLRLQDLNDFIGGGTVTNIPVGGTTNQVLGKNSNTNYDVGWKNSVTSVGLALPADFTITNSPVTTTGTLTGSWLTPPTGTGAVVRATSPTLVTPALGTPASGTLTNCTGLPVSGGISGMAAGIPSFLSTASSATLKAALTDETGSGVAVFATSPTLVTPILGTPSSGTLTSCTGLPVSTGISGLGTGVATALAVNVGSAGAPVVNGGVLGTPSSGTLTNATGLPLSGLNTQAAFTLVGNNTGSTAVPTAVSISSLTTKTTPTTSDFLLLSDQAASSAWKKVAPFALNGQATASVSYFPPQGRLTLVTATPVMITTQSAKTTIFYTPYVGNLIPLYDGINMIPTVFPETSVLTTDVTKNPAAIGASKVNDWFIWNDAGTLRITHGPDWTSDTARSAGTALTMVNGILLNNASITNGPAASRGTYVGTTRSNASSQLDWIFGASAAGGTAAWFGVWNNYNRVDVTTTVTDSTASWSTATSATPAALDTGATGSGLNNRISAVFGLAEDGSRISFGARIGGTAVAFAGCDAGFALDATNVFDKQIHTQSTSSGLSIVISCSTENSYAPQLGFHFWQATQAGDGTNAGSIAGAGFEGLNGNLRM